MSGKRIAIAGFQHETNTFSPARAAFDDFQIADSWPEMLLGEKVVHETVGLNLPIAGAAAQPLMLAMSNSFRSCGALLNPVALLPTTPSAESEI